MESLRQKQIETAKEIINLNKISRNNQAESQKEMAGEKLRASKS